MASPSISIKKRVLIGYASFELHAIQYILSFTKYNIPTIYSQPNLTWKFVPTQCQIPCSQHKCRLFLLNNIPAKSSTGKTAAAKIPILKLSLNNPEMLPTSVGPPEQPRSPPNANNANIAVPPLGMAAAARLKVPGHIIPTDRPQTAHASKLICGIGIKEMHR